ncbi:MAG: DNA polymerase III subunit alpha [Bacteroidota bacterium]|nr:DNA polymerase III subunit alpha [Bacteroidota bacterium]
MSSFCHLHCHTQYSLLDGATDIHAMMTKAKKDGMQAVALTDHGNMFGCIDFVNEAKKNKLKPILGCEFYMVKDRRRQSFLKSSGEKDARFHQLLLAKNQIGYENLSKLCSLGYIEGLYGKFPRIDKELLVQYHEGLIATSCCIGAEIPQAIIHGRMDEAETLLKWWLDIFGEDYYIEIQRQQGNTNIDGLGISQEQVNQHLLILAQKFNVKVIATNDVHYLDQEDAVSHDILLCINTAASVEDEDRFKFSSSDYFFKTSQEMKHLFHDIPFAVENTLEIADKSFEPKLDRDILIPSFPIPHGYSDQAEYLKFLVYDGAKKRYGSLTEELKDRLDFELQVIIKMDFVGYFLIVQDFIIAARELGVSVGPGRGSAAGSAVAYCLTITDIDPIKYKLLFERFLNPERVNMPDIDIDFDDRGRDKVLDYVVKKYSKQQVAQIVTFGTMAAKSSIRDVARVKRLDLPSADRLAKLVPTRPGIYLKNLLDLEKNIPDELSPDEKIKVQELRSISKLQNLEGDVLRTAKKLEGSVRNTGVHASAVIIAPDDIMKFIPVSTAKDTELWVTQVEGNVIESTGLLKMDFLGLTTLSIINDCLKNIEKRHGPDKLISLNDIPLDDKPTLELFQKGQTIGLFQFESEGMRGHLRNLKPNNIEDIIAMNALFRPGPMAYIEEFIQRKHGRVPVNYPHEWLEDLLKPTYGIMVYQEQIMQAAQIMADYSLGEADLLRRAMSKKKKDEMETFSASFIERAKVKGIDELKAKEIFDTMAKFSSYGFNRSHAAAYSILAFQTGYLKSNYPAEFIAAVLTSNKNNTDSLSQYLNEAKMMKLKVLGPDINESEQEFTVNEKGEIRFGLSALKGIGEGPVEDILEERRKNGYFLDFTDMIKRLNYKSFNKKVIESCVLGGAFDNFNMVHRAQYFAPMDKYESYIEYMLKWGSHYQHSLEHSQASLFGELKESDIEIPAPPKCEPWTSIYKLSKELEIAGIYLSSHPLDDYKKEMAIVPSCTLATIDFFKQEKVQGNKIRICGLVMDCQHRTNQKGEGFAIFKIQDYDGSLELRIFKENYLKWKNLIEPGTSLMIEGIYEKNTWKQNSEDWEFRISNIMLLSSSLNYFVKKINLFFPIQSISAQMIKDLESILKSNKGTLPLNIQVFDEPREYKLDMISNRRKVVINSELLLKLEEMGIYYSLN